MTSVAARARVRVVIPVRGLRSGKTRLSSLLGPDDRARLIAAMLHRVVEVAREVVKDVVVISPDPGVRGVAVRHGAGFALQGGLGMNNALEQARADVLRHGVGSLATISADLPRIFTADIRALLTAAAPSDHPSVTITPDASGAGTNALVLAPPDVIGLRFGHGSRARHLDEARRASAFVVLVERPGLAGDIDTCEDLAAWMKAAHRGNQEDRSPWAYGDRELHGYHSN